MPKTLTTLLLALLAGVAAWLAPGFPPTPPESPPKLADWSPQQVGLPPQPAHATNHVTVVLDTSGSMSDRGKLSYAKQLVRAMNLRAPGTVSVVSFSGRARTILSADERLDDAALAARLYDVHDGGSSNLYDGLRVAMQTSPRGSDVLVLSDGGANAGRTSPDSLQALARELHANGGRLHTVSLSPDADAVLAPLSRLGGGIHRLVDRPRDLVAVLDEPTFAALGGAQ